MKTYVFKIKASFIILIIALNSCSEKDHSYSDPINKMSESESIDSSFRKDNLVITSDSSILRTDNQGNLLGGDMEDWNFDKKTYDEIQKNNFMFRSPLFKNEPVPVAYGLDEPFTSEIEDKNVILRWFTSSEVDNKVFYVERKNINAANSDQQWNELGFVKGNGNSDKESIYKFIDDDVQIGDRYMYRLKQFSFKDESEYHYLPEEVIVMNYPKRFEVYPAYPNPVSDKATISFYLPKKEVLNIFFQNGKDTIYILDYYPQLKGFYKLTIDKKSLGFENEIKRLYINCKSCDKKKNFGDIKF